MNKKGDLAPSTLGELIIVIASGIIILVIVFGLAGFLAPTIGGFGCGLNVQLKGALLANSPLRTLDAPLIFCKQFDKPVAIDAMKFSKCPGLPDFCSTTKDKDIKSQCVQQCARIQIDKLTDSCWSMGGSGKVDLSDNLWEKLANAAPGVALSAGAFAVAILVPPAAPEAVTVGIVAAGATGADAFAPTKAQVIRCYRFQVINPGKLPNGQPFTLADAYAGRSQYYNLTKGSCTKSPCLLGGNGVAAVNPAEGETQEMRNGDRPMLNYNMTDPRQICYMMYYQYQISGGSMQYSVARSCNYWTEYLPNIPTEMLN